MELNEENLRAMFDLIDGLDFTELTIEAAGARIHVSRLDRRDAGPPAPSTGVPRTSSADEASPTSAAPPVPEPVAAGTAEAKPAPAPAAGVADGVELVTAPLLGTFYEAPKPGAPPFVTVGARVTPDTVIGMIEVMKLMNSVTAGVAGVVEELCATNGELVQFGEPLARVRR